MKRIILQQLAINNSCAIGYIGVGTPKEILLNSHNTLIIQIPRPNNFQNVYVPAPTPTPKYFSAKSNLPEN